MVLLPEPPRERNKYKPILIVIACSVALAIGSCWSFATAVQGNGAWAQAVSKIFAALFILSALAFVVGLLWLFFAFVGNIIRSARE
jgi:hypothetical protein